MPFAGSPLTPCSGTTFLTQHSKAWTLAGGHVPLPCCKAPTTATGRNPQPATVAVTSQRERGDAGQHSRGTDGMDRSVTLPGTSVPHSHCFHRSETPLCARHARRSLPGRKRLRGAVPAVPELCPTLLLEVKMPLVQSLEEDSSLWGAPGSPTPPASD